MVQQTDRVLAARMTPEEVQAVHIVWAKEGGSSDEIPEADTLRILAEIRERVARIEAHAISLASRQLQEGRRTSRRHQRFTFLLLAGAVIACLGFLAFQIWLR
jgi:hypothetical protein